MSASSTAVLPDEVESTSTVITSTTTPPVVFDETEYKELKKAFLERRVYQNVQLPGGRVLRRQVRPPILDQDAFGYKELSKRIKFLPVSYTHLTLPTNREV